jgi:heterodisulfide reductase subunit A-like polyferredoxin
MSRIGVFICHCGTNIASVVDVAKVVETIKNIPDVVAAQDLKYSCSALGQGAIKAAIKEHNLDTVVVAACSPRMHEPTFMKCIESAGLNPYQFEMANIREQCSWVHADQEKATQKAIGLVKMAIAKAQNLVPLSITKMPVTKHALVVGGGIAGMQAALDISKAGYTVTIVEKSPSIGGRMAQLEKTFPTLDCSA